MPFSLSSLKPKVTDVTIEAYGDEIIIPIVPLTYSEYHNVEIGLERPDPNDYKERTLVNGKQQDIVNTNNPEYVREFNAYILRLQRRRLGLALQKAGTKELDGLEFDELEAAIGDMDSGIATALIRHIESEAKNRQVSRFQRLPKASA